MRTRWLQAQGLAVAALTPQVADRFLADRRKAGYAAGLAAGSLEPLVGFLREVGVAPGPARPAAAGPAEALLARYAGWLARERGLAATTIERNVGLVRPFADGLVLGGQLQLDAAGGLTSSIHRYARQRRSSADGTPLEPQSRAARSVIPICEFGVRVSAAHRCNAIVPLIIDQSGGDDGDMALDSALAAG